MEWNSRERRHRRWDAGSMQVFAYSTNHSTWDLRLRVGLARVNSTVLVAVV
jgi:hypothetical protein